MSDPRTGWRASSTLAVLATEPIVTEDDQNGKLEDAVSTDEEIDYEKVIQALMRKRAEIDTAIRAIRNVVGSTGGPEPTPARNAAVAEGPSVELAPNAFSGKSIVDAAKAYLEAAKQPVPAPIIARALLAHGLKNDTKTFPNTVYSILYRDSLKPKGTVVKVGNGWVLKKYAPIEPPQPS